MYKLEDQKTTVKLYHHHHKYRQPSEFCHVCQREKLLFDKTKH